MSKGSQQRRPEPADLEELLCLVAEGISLRAACEKLGLHTPSTHTWLDNDDGRREQYARAREQRAEYLAEQALTIGMAAATGHVVNGRSIKPDGARVAIDAIKWAAARMAPKTAPVHRVAHSFETLSDEELDARIAAKLGAEDDGE
jgi:hypothetical protein